MADTWAGRREQIATEYKLDTAGINTDINALKGLVKAAAPPPTDAIDISAGTTIATNQRPIVPDLEDFTFDALPADGRLRIRHVETNFDDGIKYLHECAALRSAYTETAKEYVDTRLRAEEFFRLDQIHQLEVDAGLYELPFRDAVDELESAENSLVAARAVKALATELLNTGALSAPKVAEYVTQSGDLGHASSTQNHDRVKDLTSKVTQYRSLLDQSSWNYSLNTNTSAEAQLAGKSRTAARHKDYLQKDVTFRKARTVVSRDVAYANLAEHIRPNSPLHYAQQLAETKRHYAAAAARVAARVRAITQGCQSLYGMNLSLPNPPPGQFFDTMLTWMTDLQEKLAFRRRAERVVLYTVWLSDQRSNVGEHLKRGIVARVSANDTGGRPGLLRGFACEYLSQKALRPIRLNVEPPRDAVSDLPAGGAATPNSLVLGRVLGPSANFALGPNYADAVWNGNPYGEWRIQGFHDADRLEVQDVALHLWVAQQ